ncbi:MAG: SatD family protein [Bacillota bacterium]|nr:SatD family protein [Bacillota bacterium]
MARYFVLIGDLIGSRKIRNRGETQERLRNVLSRLNDKYADMLASRLMLTLGDEFQGIFKPDPMLLRLLDELYISSPHPFRMGLGYGEIATAIDPQMSIGADGEAFWHARAAIDRAHRENYGGVCHIYFSGGNERSDSTINTLFLLSETLKTQWTKLQRETFAALLDEDIYHEDFHQADFARKLGISESSLSRRLSLGHIKIYLRARGEITKLLEAYDESAK